VKQFLLLHRSQLEHFLVAARGKRRMT
jgi:hypothetical protein